MAYGQPPNQQPGYPQQQYPQQQYGQQQYPQQQYGQQQYGQQQYPQQQYGGQQYPGQAMPRKKKSKKGLVIVIAVIVVVVILLLAALLLMNKTHEYDSYSDFMVDAAKDGVWHKGDTVIFTDTIESITYGPNLYDTDSTLITMQSSPGVPMLFSFAGDLTSKFSAGDKVVVTLTIGEKDGGAVFNEVNLSTLVCESSAIKLA